MAVRNWCYLVQPFLVGAVAFILAILVRLMCFAVEEAVGFLTYSKAILASGSQMLFYEFVHAHEGGRPQGTPFPCTVYVKMLSHSLVSFTMGKFVGQNQNLMFISQNHYHYES